MHDKPVCVVTHRQILAGICPWCDRHIANGRVSDALPRPSTMQWNWAALEEDLRIGDRECRAITVGNLSDLSANVDKVLPLLAIALTDTEPQALFHAEFVCGQMGRDLSAEQTAWLESQRDVADRALAARIMLLGRYCLSEGKADRAARTTHIYWLIEHHPDRQIAGHPEASLYKFREPAAYQPARELWLKQCEAHKSNAAVLGNAARFFLLNDPELAEKLFLQAQPAEPDNPRLHEELAHLHSLAARTGPEELRDRQARLSLVELEMAEQIRSAHSGVSSQEDAQVTQPLTRINTLPNRARAALEAGELTFARQFAEECLALATSDEIPEFFRNDGNAIHYSHLVLGQVALREGDVEKAKMHLLESGQTTGSPNLGSFGPNMSLAMDLLEQGQRETVIAYLDQCAKFWKSGSDQLVQWKEEISKGEPPAFGANLIY